MIAAGQTAIPRSCPECGLGPCTRGINADFKYAVITSKSIHHEGDERSSTNPGNGYPAYTEEVTTLLEFDSEESLKHWIKGQPAYKTFRAIKYLPLKIATEIVVSVE